MIKGKTINELRVGDKACYQKTVTETDIYLFAGITGDNNPVHINSIEAEKTVFKERIAHGMLIGSFISTVLGTQLPGPGTIYLEQEVKFCLPVKINDTITAEVEVEELNIDKNTVKLYTSCKNQDNKVVIQGVAKVLAPK